MGHDQVELKSLWQHDWQFYQFWGVLEKWLRGLCQIMYILYHSGWCQWILLLHFGGLFGVPVLCACCSAQTVLQCRQDMRTACNIL